MNDRVKYIRTAGAEEKLARLDGAIATGRKVDLSVDTMGMRILLSAYVDLGKLRDDPGFHVLLKRVSDAGNGDDPQAAVWRKLYRLLNGVDHPNAGDEKRLALVKP